MSLSLMQCPKCNANGSPHLVEVSRTLIQAVLKDGKIIANHDAQLETLTQFEKDEDGKIKLWCDVCGHTWSQNRGD